MFYRFLVLLLMLIASRCLSGCAATGAPPDVCDNNGCVTQRVLYIDPSFTEQEKVSIVDAVTAWNAALAGNGHVEIISDPKQAADAFWIKPCPLIWGDSPATHLAGAVMDDNRICMFTETIHWSADSGPQLAQDLGYDLQFARITAHELGHVFGLPHTQDENAIMRSGGSGTCVTDVDISLFCAEKMCAKRQAMLPSCL